LIEEGNEVVNRVKIAHKEHMETLEAVQKELTARVLSFSAVASQVDKCEDVDLIISVGGDGTFLDVSTQYLICCFRC